MGRELPGGARTDLRAAAVRAGHEVRGLAVLVRVGVAGAGRGGVADAAEFGIEAVGIGGTGRAAGLVGQALPASRAELPGHAGATRGPATIRPAGLVDTGGGTGRRAGRGRFTVGVGAIGSTVPVVIDSVSAVRLSWRAGRTPRVGVALGNILVAANGLEGPEADRASGLDDALVVRVRVGDDVVETREIAVRGAHHVVRMARARHALVVSRAGGGHRAVRDRGVRARAGRGVARVVRARIRVVAGLHLGASAEAGLALVPGRTGVPVVADGRVLGVRVDAAAVRGAGVGRAGLAVVARE